MASNAVNISIWWRHHDHGWILRHLSELLFSSGYNVNMCYGFGKCYIHCKRIRVIPYSNDVSIWFGGNKTFNPVDTLRPRQTGPHVANDMFKCIFLNENVWISIKISPKFVSRGAINNMPTLVQIMAWGRPGNKRLSGSMITGAYMRQSSSMGKKMWVSMVPLRKWFWSLCTNQNIAPPLPVLYSANVTTVR